MIKIKRSIESRVISRLGKGKAIIIYGARQTGKTTLAEMILSKYSTGVLKLNGDEPDVREIISNAGSQQLKNLIGPNKCIFIDEAQRITNIGLALKLIVDNITGVQVIATGSSSFELNEKISEPLTGRKYEFRLYPISFNEMTDRTSLLEEKRLTAHRMIFGYYPEIVVKPEEETELLKNLAASYLYKDILNFELVRNTGILDKLLRSLALQIGSEVSYNELARQTGADSKSVEKYIDLLEKSFIIFRLNAFSGNHRNEIKKGKKIYFYDNGIRNAIIANFSPLSARTDSGQLWENFIVSERLKFMGNNNLLSRSYFWRTFQQSEIDYVEESNAQISAFEFKLNKKARIYMPAAFKKNYGVKEIKLISPDNIEEFVNN